MASWDVRLLLATYRMEGNESVIELHAKGTKGESLLLRYRGFHPYFYLVNPSAKVRKAIESNPDVRQKECRDETLRVGTEEKPCLKVVVNQPFRVPEYRQLWGEDGNVLAADIPFGMRFMYDLGLGGCTRAHGKEVPKESRGALKVDHIIEVDRFEEIPAFRAPLRILSFDIETSIKTGRVLCVCGVVQQGDGPMEPFEIVNDNEVLIVREFEKTVQAADPDVITGYNIDNFDIPQLNQALRRNRNERDLQLGRDRSEVRAHAPRGWRITGRVVADAWWNVKRIVRPKQETLAAVSKSLLGETKLDVDPRRMDEEWAADRPKVLRYCTQDAVLALKLLRKVAVLDRFQDLGSVARLPLEDAMNGTTSQLVDSLLIRQADQAKVAVPMTRRDRTSERIEGGYVHAIEGGLHRFIIGLDYKSMYPSMMISNNICFTTKVPKGTPVPAGAHLCRTTGVAFVPKSVREGLIPRCLRQLLADREAAKTALKEAKKKKDAAGEQFYQGLQDAIKILANSFFGVLASNFYRFTDNDIGGSITAFAREGIQSTIAALEKEGLAVVYSDTDSVFIVSNPDGATDRERLAQTVERGQELARKFSAGVVQMEFDKVYDPFFSHGKKKRYVGRIRYPPTDEILVRGYETRRTDAFNFQSAALENVFETILSDKAATVCEVAREWVRKVQRGEVPTEDLVISRTSQDESAYKADPNSLLHVRVMKELKRRGYPFTPGMKVSWIVTNARKTPQEAEPWLIGVPFDGKPDLEYYARRVAQTLGRVTETFGCDESQILSGQQQVTLETALDGESGSAGDAAVPRAKKGGSAGGPGSKKSATALEDFL